MCDWDNTLYPCFISIVIFSLTLGAVSLHVLYGASVGTAIWRFDTKYDLLDLLMFSIKFI